MSSAGPLERRWRPPYTLDLGATGRPLWQGPGDPQVRLQGSSLALAARTPSGPGTLLAQASAGAVHAQAWGSGAGWLLDSLPALLGADDQPERLVPAHPIVADLARRQAGLRLTRSGRLFDALLPAIIAQKVTGTEARASFRLLVRRWGEPAPGPLGLYLPPLPATLAASPYWRYHAVGLERRRADTIRHAAAVAARLEEAGAQGIDQARRRLLALPGIGAWTVAETLRVAYGDPDAVSLGDFHVPNLVCWALAGEPRGDDARMLELLAPYVGQRARVVLLLESGGPYPPRYGPRLAPRAIRAI